MKNLKIIRKQRGLSQKELGHLIGVAESSICLYESGKRQPDNETLIKLAKALNTSVDFLLGKVDDEKKADIDGLPLTEQQQKLFDAASDLPDDDIKQALDYIELLKLKRNQKPE